MRRFPRLLLVPLAVASAVAAAAALANGCSGPNYESVCDWLAEPDNCLRVFHQDALANHNTSADNPTGDCRFLTTDGGSPTEASATSAGVPNGTFPPGMVGMPNNMLASCIIYSGGSVTFNPPLDPTSFPPAPDAGPFMITLGNSDTTTCGTATYSSPYSFSISINALPPTDGGTGGAGTGGSVSADAGYGTFTEVNQPPSESFTVTCPSGETHLLNLDEINGASSRCPDFAGILPQASLQVFPGGIDVPGGVSFAIAYPPLDAGTPYQDSGTPIAPDRVVYFNCTIPAAPETCHDGVQDGFETDIDCGGPQIPSKSPCGTCPARCGPMQQCRCDADCEMGLICVTNIMSGMLQCTAPDAGVPDNFTTCSWTNMPVACADGGAGDGG